MRKDLKFGLTIGAILVVTLVVYVTVLSRGPAIPGNKLVIDTGNGGVITPGDSSGVTPKTDDQGSDQSGNATGVQDETATPDAAAPMDSHNAATQPASVVDRNDWNGALNNGLPPSMSAAAAPQRTETPMIDGPAVSLAGPASGINRDAATPMIDALPTTQPAAPAMASVPRQATIDAAAPPPAVVDPPAVNGQRTHRVAAGETPSSIAAAVYGNSKYYKRILAANPGIDAHRLKIGQILVIPEMSDAEKNSSAGSGATDAASSVDPAAAYKVGPGDTLQRISRKLYGSIGMAEKLYQLNKGLIGTDENVLKVGWVLKLPIAPTVASAAH
jgi:nucleoid-associated protein YgaU